MLYFDCDVCVCVDCSSSNFFVILLHATPVSRCHDDAGAKRGEWRRNKKRDRWPARRHWKRRCPRCGLGNWTTSTSRNQERMSITVDSYTSHESFSRTLSHLCTHHIVAQGVFGAHSFHPHAIHDVTCLSVRWLFLVLSSSSPRLYFLSTVYLFSVLHINFNVESAEDSNHCTMRSIAPWRCTTLLQSQERGRECSQAAARRRK